MYSKLFKKYRYSAILLKELVKTDFKLRYQGSALGYLWSLLRPIFLFVVLYIVFVYFLRIGSGIEHWPVALLLGIVMWNFFTEITKQGLKSIVSSGGIIRKVNFPKYVIVLSTSVSAIINMLINLLVVAVFAVINHVELSWGVLMLPLFILEIFILALGTAFLLATINVKYRDIDYIWDVVLQVMFYASAVIFPISKIIERDEFLAKVLLMNPVSQAIQDARYFAINDSMPTLHTITNEYFVIIPIAMSLAIFVIGALYFRKKSPTFAENV